MDQPETQVATPIVVDLGDPPTRSDVGMESGSIAKVIDDRAGGTIRVTLRTADGEVTLDAVSVVYESERSTTDPARAVVKLPAVPLDRFADGIERLAPLAPATDVDAVVGPFVDAASAPPSPEDSPADGQLTLVPVSGTAGIDVYLRASVTSGDATATVYVTWS